MTQQCGLEWGRACEKPAWRLFAFVHVKDDVMAKVLAVELEENN